MQIHLPEDAYNITVYIKNVATNSRGINGPTAGKFMYTQRMDMVNSTNDMLDTGVTFSNRNGTTADYQNYYTIGNKYPIRNITIAVTSWATTSSYKQCGIGRIWVKYDKAA